MTMENEPDRTPAIEINAVAPHSLRHMIGQTNVIQQVETALDAAQMDGRKFDHALLVGPPGLGKSALAMTVAAEMASPIHDCLGQSLNKPAELNSLLLAAKDRDIVFIDEAHEMKRVMQTALYLALDKQKLFVRNGSGPPMGIPLGNFSLLLASTDEYRLLQPLRDRMKLVLRFEFYSEEELTQILHHRCRGLGWSVEEEVFSKIAQRGRGTPRIALRLLQSSHRVARSLGETTITEQHLAKALELEQTNNPLGLDPTEQAYLRIVAAGPTRLNVISSVLNLPARTISDVTESYLIRAGLVIKDTNSVRQLTQKGHEFLSELGGSA